MPHAPFRLWSACAAPYRGRLLALALALLATSCALDPAGTGANPALGFGGSGGGGGSGDGSSTSSGGSGGEGGTLRPCGNGIPEAGEACDDGNSVQGDGCSPECVRERPDACPGVAITLTPPGLTIMNDTSGASNDTGIAPCGGSFSPDMVYQITATTDGWLKASLTAEFDTLLYARYGCPGVEGINIVCADDPAVIEGKVDAQQTFYLFVDGRGDGPEQGPFILELELDLL
jgi:cysteine-rich repeat protein